MPTRLPKPVLKKLPPLDMQRKHKRKEKFFHHSRSSTWSSWRSRHKIGSSSTPLPDGFFRIDMKFNDGAFDLQAIKNVPTIEVVKLKKEIANSIHSLHVALNANTSLGGEVRTLEAYSQCDAEKRTLEARVSKLSTKEERLQHKIEELQQSLTEYDPRLPCQIRLAGRCGSRARGGLAIRA
ncbi:hypothetical protein VNO80_26900 [Phaseolus coccineus]|uniref:Uncharacterized protein n=1 Tax=Phaseolus coccineus TaxID=3886 RepID=A0AAN9LGE3_PHACN